MSWSVGIKDKTKEDAKAAVLEQVRGEEHEDVRKLLLKVISNSRFKHVTLGGSGVSLDDCESIVLNASSLTLHEKARK